jgi:hypothetical protein
MRETRKSGSVGALGRQRPRATRRVRRTGRDKKRAYRIAAAEAQEVRAALEAAVAWGWVDDAAVAAARALADRVARVTYALAR